MWDAVRNAVDERGEDGQFILTGSTVIEDKNKEIRHTRTGRIARVVSGNTFQDGDTRLAQEGVH